MEPAWLALRGRIWKLAPNASDPTHWEEPWRDWLIRTSPKSWVRKMISLGDVVVTSTAASGSQSVTVPEGTDLCVLASGGWHGSQQLYPATAFTLDGVAKTTLQSANNASFMKGELAYWEQPASGSRTFAWTLNGAGPVAEGGIHQLMFFAGVRRATPVLDSDQNTDQVNVAQLGSPARGDLMVGFSVTGGGQPAPALAGQGQTLLSATSFNSGQQGAVYKLGVDEYETGAAAAGDQKNFAATFAAQPFPKMASSRSSLGSSG